MNNRNSESYQKEVPAYADERAAKFFRIVYIGYPTKYTTTFLNDHPDLLPTQTVVMDGFLVYCAYCANRAYLIQHENDELDDTKLYCCICPDAFKELETLRMVSEATSEYNKLVNELMRDIPKVNMKKLLELRISVLQSVKDARLEQLAMQTKRSDAFIKARKAQGWLCE